MRTYFIVKFRQNAQGETVWFVQEQAYENGEKIIVSESRDLATVGSAHSLAQHLANKRILGL